MRATAILELGFLAAVAVGTAKKPEPLNVRLGLWEITRTATASDEMQIPRELLEKLTPEQRARLNDRMRARSSEAAKKNTTRYCLTTERLNQGIPFDQSREYCIRTVVSSSQTKIEVRMHCSNAAVHEDGILRIERLSSESIQGEMQSLGGNRDRGMRSSFTARWICPICDGTK